MRARDHACYARDMLRSLLTRRAFIAGSVALAVILALSMASAIASTHRSFRVSGVVTAINARDHAFRLRAKDARRVMTVKLARATVISGHGGAVIVGDDVTTTSDTSGSVVTASSIRILGLPNGGIDGHGAAVPGVVDSVDTVDSTLAVSVQASDGSGPVLETVDVSSTTILAITDGGSSLSDIAVGDRVLIFTPDMTATPLQAAAILDTGPGSAQDRGVSGIVSALSADSLTLTVGSDNILAGQSVVVTVNAHTQFGGDNVTAIDEITVGDEVEVTTASLVPPLLAVSIVDGGPGSDLALPPTASVFPVTALASARAGSTVTFNGVVNTQGLPTTYAFYLAKMSCALSSSVLGAVGTPNPIPAASLPASFVGPESVSYQASDLTPNTTYCVGLIASNAVGTSSNGYLEGVPSDDYFEFTTPALQVPQATMLAPTAIGATSATFNASINDDNLPTNYSFYVAPGPCSLIPDFLLLSKGAAYPVEPLALQPSTSAQGVSYTATGLTADVIYCVGIYAVNDDGSDVSGVLGMSLPDSQMITLAASPPSTSSS